MAATPLPTLTFLYGQAAPQCTHAINKVFDGYCTLQYMASGSVSLKLGESVYSLSGRYFWSCYPGPQIRFGVSPECSTWNHHYIAFHGDLVDRWREEGLFPVPPQKPPHGVDYSVRFDELLALSRRADAWGLRRAQNVLEAILIELAEARTTGAGDVLVDRALTILQESDDPRDCADLAGDLGISQRTLRRRFSDATGQAPKQYLIAQRIASARRLLAETDTPIKQIATRLGYRDVFFFTRQFTKSAGVSPARYRRSCAG